MSASTQAIVRNSYGEITRGDVLDAARALVAQAGKKLPMEFDGMEWGTSGKERGHRIGEARHHEIYDVNGSGTQALVCVREVEGTKYGVKTCSKEYFVVASHGRGIRVIPANKAVAAKAAKASGDTIGQAIEVALGKAKLTVKSSEVRTGYKLLERTNTSFKSCFDGSGWHLGEARIEAASDNHTGGFYYYASLQEALLAASNNDVFGGARTHHKLAVVEVEASGRHYAHQADYGTKLCATKVRPIREVASTI